MRFDSKAKLIFLRPQSYGQIRVFAARYTAHISIETIDSEPCLLSVDSSQDDYSLQGKSNWNSENLPNFL